MEDRQCDDVTTPGGFSLICSEKSVILLTLTVCIPYML